MALQIYTLALGNLKDDQDGNNYSADTPVYILKSDGLFADIYRDSSGSSLISQNGIDNISNESGEFKFYVESGQYIARVNGKENLINVIGSTYFDSRIEDSVSQIIEETLSSRGFRVVGAFADGFTYELFNDVGIDADGNSWIYLGEGAPNKVVSAGTVPSVSAGYEQVTFESVDYKTLAEAIASSNISAGDVITINERIEGNNGGAKWRVINKGGTSNVDLPNGMNIVSSTTFQHLALKLIVDNGMTNPKRWGAISGDNTDIAPILESITEQGYAVVLDYNDSFYVSSGNMPSLSSVFSLFHSDQNVPKLIGLDPNKNILEYADGAGCEIIGIGFDYGTTVGAGKPISMLNPTRSTIRNCAAFTCPNGFDLFGTLGTSPGNNIWKDNYFSNIGGTALRLYRTHNDFVHGNRVDAAGKCLHMEHSCFDNIVTENEFSHSDIVALETDGNSVGHIISDNIFAINRQDLKLSGRSYTIQGNLFKESDEHSIYLNIFRDSTISGNKFRGVAKLGNGSNRFSSIYGNNAVENCNIIDNIFGSELPITAQYCVLLRYSKNNKIKDNQMERGYVTAPILDEFPSGRNEYQEVVVEATSVVYDSAIPDACEPWQPAVAGTYNIDNPPPITRIMSVSFKNNTEGVLNGTETIVKNFRGSVPVTITASDLSGMAAGEVRTFRCGAGSRNNSNMATNIAVAQPTGMQIAFGVWDGFQVMGGVSSESDIISVYVGGASPTVTNFDSVYGDFDVSLKPNVGDSVSIIYTKSFNNI